MQAQPSVSFCMIAKNEAHQISRCLKSVQPHVDEMVVVDTGSTDETVAIAQQHGARLAHFAWCDDFSAARNFAIAQTQCDWILTLDADEELKVDVSAWREQLLKPGILAYWVPILDLHQGITAIYYPRLFQNLPVLRYVKPYHESLIYQGEDPTKNVVNHQDCIQILHHGYEPNVVVQKNLHRDIPMLERIRQQRGLGLLLLGTLADNYLRIDQIEKAQACWAEIFERILPNLLDGEMPEEKQRLPAILLTLGLNFLLEQQDYDSAGLISRRGLEWFPDYPPLNYLAGLLLREMGFTLGAIAYFERCLDMGQTGNFYQQESFDQRYMGVFPAHQLGLAYQAFNLNPDAQAAFKLALTFEPDYIPALDELAKLNLS